MSSEAIKTNEKFEWWQALPFPFTSCRVTQGSRPDGFRFYPHIINIEAKLLGGTVRACGEAFDSESAMTKAVAELLERAALLTWKIKMNNPAISSNGWAAHSSPEAAKISATLELIERDAALSQWYTATPFLELTFSELPTSIQEWHARELARSEFPNLKFLISTEGLGPSVTCLFLNSDGLGVSAHATRATLESSIQSAIGEACRAAHMALRKSFWKETLALKNNGEGLVSPGAHSVYYAYHEAFPAWMFGETVSWESSSKIWETRIEAALKLETSFQLVLDQPASVGFVANELAFPLVFGVTNKEMILKTTASKRFAVQRTEWNLKPHIIS